MNAPLFPTTTYPRLTDLDSVIDACAAHPDVQPYARVVGKWVWCEFPTKPSADVRDFLKGTGFRWNADRLAWQHNCGTYARRNRRIDPRMVYGETPLYGQAGPAYVAPAIPPDRIQHELASFQTS